MLPEFRIRPRTVMLLNRRLLNSAEDSFKIDLKEIGYIFLNSRTKDIIVTFNLAMKSGSYNRWLCLTAIPTWNFFAYSHWLMVMAVKQITKYRFRSAAMLLLYLHKCDLNKSCIFFTDIPHEYLEPFFKYSWCCFHLRSLQILYKICPIVLDIKIAEGCRTDSHNLIIILFYALRINNEQKKSIQDPWYELV
jgi:hypothetical protein